MKLKDYKPPAFQFYSGDYLSSLDVKMMTQRQELGYLRLLIQQWVLPGCALPNDETYLASTARMTIKEWREQSAPIMRKFSIKKRKIFNKKMRKQFLDLYRYFIRSSSAGHKGAQIKKLMAKPPLSPPTSTPTSTPLPLQSSSSSSSSSSPSTDKHPNILAAYDAAFSEFWNHYPPRNGKKNAKGAAWKEWQKTAKIRPQQEALIATLEAQKKTWEWRKENGAFVPDARKWLHNRMWEDEITPKKPVEAFQAPPVPEKKLEDNPFLKFLCNVMLHPKKQE